MEAILIISCGYNDMDHEGGLDVHHEIIETIYLVRQTYRAKEVMLCNGKLNESVKHMENAIKHYNLRDDNMRMFIDI